MKIKNLASVQTGYTFRSRLELSENGNISIIQMRDLLDNNTVCCNNLVKVNMQNVKKHHLAQKGDLIFRSRGHITTAALIKDDPGKSVVAAPLLRIRVTNQDKVLPEYLNWYIAQQDAQIFLNSRAKGTVQKMISKQTIEDLEVNLPDLEKQKKIVELAFLSDQEQILIHKLAKKRLQYMTKILNQFAKGEKQR